MDSTEPDWIVAFKDTFPVPSKDTLPPRSPPKVKVIAESHLSAVSALSALPVKSPMKFPAAISLLEANFEPSYVKLIPAVASPKCIPAPLINASLVRSLATVIVLSSTKSSVVLTEFTAPVTLRLPAIVT